MSNFFIFESNFEDSHIRTCELPFEFLRGITEDFSEGQIVSESAFVTVFKVLILLFR